KPLRWRLRFLLFAVVTIAMASALFFARRSALRALDERLAGNLDPGRAEAVVSDVADTLAVTAIAGVIGGGVLALLLGHVLVQQLGRVRADTVARSRGEPGPPIARPPIAELQALAAAIELLATEQGARLAALTRERDDLAMLVSSVSEGMLQVAPDGRIVHANPAARRLLGLPRVG